MVENDGGTVRNGRKELRDIGIPKEFQNMKLEENVSLEEVHDNMPILLCCLSCKIELR